MSLSDSDVIAGIESRRQEPAESKNDHVCRTCRQLFEFCPGHMKPKLRPIYNPFRREARP